MTDQYPITPSEELLASWYEDWLSVGGSWPVYGATQAARWGADQELEACSEWLLNSAPWTVEPNERPEWTQTLKECRRPKPPSLKKQALAALGRFSSNAHTQASQMTQDFETIRRAVVQLDD